MSDQLDDVRERLAGTWTLHGEEVWWMVTRIPNAKQRKVHAIRGVALTGLCGAHLGGMWRKRKQADPALRCADCMAVLERDGVYR